MAYVDVSALAGITLLAGIDPVTRDFYLSAATVNANVHPMDIYSEMRICRRLDENLRGFEVFLAAFGNVAKGGGKFTERYVQQLLGTRFIPFDGSHEITIIGTVITDDGQEGVACFDRSSLTPTSTVDISYVPPQVEVVRAEAELAALVKSGYNDRIVINTTGSGYAGTGQTIAGDYIGTKSAPSNNLADAITIAEDIGITEFDVTGTLTLDSGVLAAYIFDGIKATSTIIISDPGANSFGVEIRNAQVSGDFDGLNTLRECLLGAITNYSGFMDRCGFNIPTVAIGGTTSFIDCFSNVAGSGSPTLDLGGTGASKDVAIRGWKGGCQFINRTDALSEFSADITSGHMQVEATCSAGNLTFRGIGRTTDSSTGTCNVNDTAMLNGSRTIKQQGYVTIESPGSAGVEFPVGTDDAPVNNFADALLLAAANNVKAFKILGAMTTAGTEDLTDYVMYSSSAVRSSVVITAGTITEETIFRELDLSGALSGTVQHIERCNLGTLTGIAGFVYQSFFYGDLQFAGDTAISFCAISTNSVGREVDFDFNGGTHEVICSAWSAGSVRPLNMVTGSFLTVAGTAGIVSTDTSCTGGTLVRDGTVRINDTFEANFDQSLDFTAQRKIWDDKSATAISAVLGLEIGNPVTIGNGSYLANGLQIDVTDNLDGTYTLNRTV